MFFLLISILVFIILMQMYKFFYKNLYKTNLLINIAQIIIIIMKKPDNVVFDIHSQEYDSYKKNIQQI